MKPEPEIVRAKSGSIYLLLEIKIPSVKRPRHLYRVVKSCRGWCAVCVRACRCVRDVDDGDVDAVRHHHSPRALSSSLHRRPPGAALASDAGVYRPRASAPHPARRHAAAAVAATARRPSRPQVPAAAAGSVPDDVVTGTGSRRRQRRRRWRRRGEEGVAHACG